MKYRCNEKAKCNNTLRNCHMDAWMKWP